MNKFVALCHLVIMACSVATLGCQPLELPDSFEVAISGTQKLTGIKGAGIADAANGTWTGRRGPDAKSDGKAAPGPYGGLLNGGILERPPVEGQIFVADFNSEGGIIEIRENKYFLPQVYGETLEIGSDWARSRVPFIRFKSASYGVQQEDKYGLAVLVHVRLGPFYVGRAIIYSWGTSDPTLVSGQFGYLLDFEKGLADLLLDSGGDQYGFNATRDSS